MINSKVMKSLFKPRKQADKFSFKDFLNVTGLTEKKFLKIHVENECSKATDESCINTECQYNLLNLHENELYIEVLQEIQHERKEIEKKIERDRKKYGYI